MSAPSPMGLIERVERWIYQPGSARRLAGVRIGLCLLLAARLSRPMYLQLAGQPRLLFRPISFMRLFPAMPPASVVLMVQVVAVAACLFGAAGLASRVAIAVGWVGSLFLNGMWTSIGQPMHNDTLLILAMVPLLIAPSADAWSVAAARTASPPAESSVRYGWPVRTAMIVTAGGYFFSGLNKVIFSGPAWFLSDNLRWILFGLSDQSPRPIKLALLLASHPLLAHVAAGLALLTEVAFPILLWKPRAEWVLLPGVTVLHAGIALTMHLDYSAWALTAIVVFVPWQIVADRRRSAGRAQVTVARPDAAIPTT